MTTNGGTRTSFSAWPASSEGGRFVSSIADGILSLLYPPECAVCGEVVDRGRVVCDRCFEALPRLSGSRCRVCGDLLPDPSADLCLTCGTRIRPFERIVSLAPYEGGWERLIHLFKFEGERAIGRWLGSLLARLARNERLDEGVDLVSYVPMTREERRERGFNQAEILAREVAGGLGLPLERTLVKVRRTAPQRTLSVRERRENLRGAFKVIRSEEGGVLLVDDVCTTSATVDECARALVEGGYSPVFVLTVARA